MPQLVDHAHIVSCIVIGCNLVQPRATSQKNERVYFWLQSHRSCITVAVANCEHEVARCCMASHGCRSHVTVTVVNNASVSKTNR